MTPGNHSHWFIGRWRIWNAANNNGIQDANEAEIANVVASLWTVGTIQVGTTTNATGKFSFVNPKLGTDKERVTAPAGSKPTIKGTDPTSATDSNIHA